MKKVLVESSTSTRTTHSKRRRNCLLVQYLVKATLVAFVGISIAIMISLLRSSMPERIEDLEDLLEIDALLGASVAGTNNIISTTQIDSKECKLPPCELVLQSRLFSERCDPNAIDKWPLLVTGTPRSATTYMSAWLTSYGMKLEDDWHHPKFHGTSSWIFAFEDEHNFGPARTKGGKFRHVLHQVRDPLKSITAMCAVPLHDGACLTFLQRHINVSSSLDDWNWKAVTTLNFWVDWHQYLNDMKFPTYQIEQVRAEDMFRMAGLEKVYNSSNVDKKVSKDHNTRRHRSGLSWQDLYSLDPELAAKAWDLAHYFNYSYPDVDFDSLTCLDHVPTCDKINLEASPKCPPGTHPFPKDGKKIALKDLPVSTGFQGWVNDGCVEHKNEDGTFVGMNGAQKYLANA